MRSFMFCLIPLAWGCASDPGPETPDVPMDVGLATDASRDTGGPDDVDASDPADMGMADQMMAMPDAAIPDCDDRVSLRADGELRVNNCRFSRAGEGAVVPHGVVVSEDSLTRNVRTPYHEPGHYADLAQRGFTMAWILVTWDGIEPQENLYNAAYMGRVCQQALWAAEAGLDPILVMYQDRIGPVFGGHGFPAWVTPDGGMLEPNVAPTHSDLLRGWDVFWRRRSDALLAAWTRLLDTCVDTGGVAGLTPLANPVARVTAEAASRMDAFNTAVAVLGRERLGPLLTLVEPLSTEEGVVWPDLSAPDTVLAASSWGPGRGPHNAVDDVVGWLAEVRSARNEADSQALLRGSFLGEESVQAVLTILESAGIGWMHWTDRFGGEVSLRDGDGIPTPAMDDLAQRPWPVVVSGRPSGFGATEEGWSLNWRTDLSNQGLTRISTGSLGSMIDLRVEPEGIDSFWDYDPVLGQVQVFVQTVGVDARVVIIPVTAQEEP